MFGDSWRLLQSQEGLTPVVRMYSEWLISILFVIWATMPLLFEPPRESIRFRLLAPPGLTCEDWNPIIRGREDPAAIVEGCTQLSPADPDPLENPRHYIQPGEGIGDLVSSLSNCSSGETRRAADRYYLIVCSPNRNTFNVLSWPHELGHLAGGHGSLQYTFVGGMYRLPEPFKGWSKEALNAFLDIGYVDPALVLGQLGSVWFRNAAIGTWIGLLLLRMRRRAKLRTGET